MWETLLNFMNQQGQEDPDITSADRISAILNANADKNFVQRILKPDLYPLLDEYAGPGTHGTHLMSSGEYNGQNMVYPEIIQRNGGNLERLGRNEAMEYAAKSGENIKFKTPEEALWFGQNYKRAWGRR